MILDGSKPVILQPNIKYFSICTWLTPCKAQKLPCHINQPNLPPRSNTSTLMNSLSTLSANLTAVRDVSSRLSANLTAVEDMSSRLSANLTAVQGRKLLSCSHCKELCQQESWLLIGCTRVNNHQKPDEQVDPTLDHDSNSKVSTPAIYLRSISSYVIHVRKSNRNIENVT